MVVNCCNSRIYLVATELSRWIALGTIRQVLAVSCCCRKSSIPCLLPVGGTQVPGKTGRLDDASDHLAHDQATVIQWQQRVANHPQERTLDVVQSGLNLEVGITVQERMNVAFPGPWLTHRVVKECLTGRFTILWFMLVKDE